ncbi:MAG: hypothetical protein V4615_05770 [Bacteroidota bacterium]
MKKYHGRVGARKKHSGLAYDKYFLIWVEKTRSYNIVEADESTFTHQDWLVLGSFQGSGFPERYIANSENKCTVDIKIKQAMIDFLQLKSR